MFKDFTDLVVSPIKTNVRR